MRYRDRARLRSIALSLCVLAPAGCLLEAAEPPPRPSFWRLPRGEASLTSSVGPRAPSRDNPDLHYTAEERDRFIRAYVEGYALDGAPLGGRLDGAAPIVFHVDEGRCYVFAYRLDPEATLSAEARVRLVVAVRVPEDDGVRVSSAMRGPGGVGSVGCPPASGEATLELVAGTGPGGSRHAVGRGRFTVELYSRPSRGEGI